MTLSHRRSIAILLPLLLVLLVGCGGTTPQTQTKPTPTATPVPPRGQQLLDAMGQKLKTATTLHGIFNLTITGQAANGAANTEIWNAAPNKYRTVVLQSSLPQVETGSITVSDGKQIWQYDPAKKVVYNGPMPTAPASTPTEGPARGVASGQSQFLLRLVQTVLTQSDASLSPATTTVNGHSVYDVHVTPQSSASDNGLGNFNYAGEVYIDKTTQLPVEINLDIQSVGKVLLDLPSLALNQPIPANTFTFVVPDGVKVLPLPQGTADTGAISLAQAEQQAGYHLLSIPGSQSDYLLQSVTALGAPGNQIYTLNYTKGNLNFTIAEGKPLANLPTIAGQQINLRGTTAVLSSENGGVTLAWTEKGVGIRITGNLSNDQAMSIASMLS
jgi:outer membrane lipoprotein-sorting protein